MSFLGIEIMCFLKSQNLEENPPNTKDSISETLQVALEGSLVKFMRSSQLFSPIYFLIIYSFLSSIDMQL